MNLPEFSIHRPVTVLMACLIAMLLGTIALIQIPVDLMPETEYPTISVTTRYEGVAPEEMETLISRPLEQALASAPGAEEITSSSTEGNSSVRVRFIYGTNLDEAANELRARIDRRRNSLPDDIDPRLDRNISATATGRIGNPATAAALRMWNRCGRDFLERTINRSWSPPAALSRLRS